MSAPGRPARDSGRSQAASVARTQDPSRCQVGAERPRPSVVDLGRVEVEVQPRGLVHEGRSLGAVDQARGAVVTAERVEVRPQLTVDPAVLRTERVPAGPIGRRVAREDRRHVLVEQLGRVARGDPDPRPARRRQGREGHHVVLHDHVGSDLVEDLEKPGVDVLRAVDERRPGRLDEPRQLLDGGRPEDRGRVADEVLPELARDLGDLRRRTEPHEPLLEALRLERPGERLLDHEHDPMAPIAQDGADPDAVVGRAEGPLREEDDGPAVGHGR